MRISSRFTVALAGALATVAAVTVSGAVAVPSWSLSRTAVSPATPEQIWAWYADPADWPNWDHLVQHVATDGAFADGSRARSTSNGMTMPSVLRDVMPNVRYTEVMEMPLATLTATHELHREAGGTRIEHGMTIAGPAAWLYRLLQRDALASGMEAAIDRLAAHAAGGLPRSYIP